MHNQHDGYIDNADGTVSRNGTAQTYSLRASDTRDASGRVTDHKEFKDDGVTVTFRRQVSAYNAAGQVISESTSGLAGASTTTYNYGAGGSTYANGAVVSQSGTSTNTAGQTSSNTVTNSFVWRQSALQNTVSNAQSGAATANTKDRWATASAPPSPYCVFEVTACADIRARLHGD